MGSNWTYISKKRLKILKLLLFLILVLQMCLQWKNPDVSIMFLRGDISILVPSVFPEILAILTAPAVDIIDITGIKSITRHRHHRHHRHQGNYIKSSRTHSHQNITGVRDVTVVKGARDITTMKDITGIFRLTLLNWCYGSSNGFPIFCNAIFESITILAPDPYVIYDRQYV